MGAGGEKHLKTDMVNQTADRATDFAAISSSTKREFFGLFSAEIGGAEEAEKPRRHWRCGGKMHDLAEVTRANSGAAVLGMEHAPASSKACVGAARK